MAQRCGAPNHPLSTYLCNSWVGLEAWKVATYRTLMRWAQLATGPCQQRGGFSWWRRGAGGGEGGGAEPSRVAVARRAEGRGRIVLAVRRALVVLFGASACHQLMKQLQCEHPRVLGVMGIFLSSMESRSVVQRVYVCLDMYSGLLWWFWPARGNAPTYSAAYTQLSWRLPLTLTYVGWSSWGIAAMYVRLVLIFGAQGVCTC